MALSLAKVPSRDSKWNGKTADWLTRNINQERIHTRWWKRWAKGFGVAAEVFEKEINPPAEMDAVNNYLWHICSHGSLVEGISASNFAIEGPTGEWTRNIVGSLRRHQIAGATVDDHTLQWVDGHAHYDDKHPQEALEIVKAFAISEDDQQRAQKAAQRTLELYALALDYCYDHPK
jgi:pyrroloquinoline quinone (PQQ) biosynthesis protein C